MVTEPASYDDILAEMRANGGATTLETRRALALLEEGLVDLPRFVTHRLPLARAAEGFELAARGGEALKVLIEI